MGFQGLTGFGGGATALSQKSSSIKATGGTEFEDGGYYFHVFTGPGSLDVNVSIAGADYLVVGGGGGGAVYNGGGGGAGGVRTDTITLPVASHTITVGDGGSPPTVNTPTGTPQSGYGDPGDPSSLGSLITSAGGGGGGGKKTTSSPPYDGQDGGSGGGGGAYPNSSLGSGGSGNTPPVSPSQGNDGGAGQFYSHPNAGGGGGGGAGVTGGTVTTRRGGDGVAVPWVPPSYGTPGPSPGRWFGGGGTGGCPGGPGSGQQPGAMDCQPGGAGGGGWGNNYTYADWSPIGGPAFGLMYCDATIPPNGDNTGGGGGGGGGNGWADTGKGAKGIVIVRYAA